MSIWCRNFLNVTGPEQDLARFQQQAAGLADANDDTPEVFSFENLVPLPQRNRTESIELPGCSEADQEWGCQDDACECEREEALFEGVDYRFKTLLKPPLPFLRQVSQRWPTLVFKLEYEEPRPLFCGLASATAGSMQHSQLED